MYFKTFFLKLTFVILTASLVVSCNRKNGSTNIVSDTISTASTKELSKQIERDASNPELYYQRSVVYFNEKSLNRSLTDIDQAIALNQTNPLYYYFKGKVLFAMNQTLKASDAFEMAIKLKPDYTEARLKAAELYYIVKSHQKSLAHLNAVIGIEPENANAFFLKGMNLKEMKDTAKALDAFQTAYEDDKNFYDAAIQLGLLYTAKKSKLALDYFNAAIRMNPKSDEAYFARAVYYQNNKQFTEALADYRKVISINPSNDIAYYNVGYINFDTKHFEEALRNWNICIQMNKNNVKAYYMRGLVHEINKEKTEARSNYQYALQIDPAYELAKEGLKRLDK